MCGRYTVLTEEEIIEIRGLLQSLSMRIVKDEFEEYDMRPGEVFPTNSAPAITSDGEGGISFESAKWGFKKFSGPGVIINARSETIRVKSMFSRLIKGGRCVIPAGEFFEWEKLEKKKRKHFAKDREGNILFMAGLYRDSAEDGGREFVIITREAGDEMSRIHDRQPVILRADQVEDWLSGRMSPEELKGIECDLSVMPCDEEEAGQVMLTFPEENDGD